MFRTLVLSVPLAIVPLAAVQLVETLLRESLLPDLAGEMHRAASGRSGDAPYTAPERQEGLAPSAAELAATLPLTLRF